MKQTRLKYYIAFVIIIAVAIGALFDTALTSKNNKDDQVFVVVNKFSTTKPDDIKVLFNERINDTRENVKLFSFTLLSNENIIISESSPLNVSANTALNVMKVNLKDYSFPEPIEKKAVSYRWMDKNHQWSMTIVKTSVGFYSHWEMLTGLY